MKRVLLLLLSVAAALGTVWESAAQNPYLPLWEHLPDGEPRIFEDPDRPGKYRLYVVGSHDTLYDFYCGVDTRMWSAPLEDLSDWRDEGAIFTLFRGGQWDVMYAPDLVETVRPDGSREYWLYPNSRGWMREPMVARSSRPDGPYEAVNLTDEGVIPGSIFGFDPGVYVEQATDSEAGFRAWGFWGFKHSQAAELDPATMYSVRPGTETISCFIPSSDSYGVICDPPGTEYPHLFPGENLLDYNFFEASSIRRVGNKYLLIYSGYSGPDYGMTSSNATLRYAFGDTPLGPWKMGGVLVDARGPVPDENGTSLRVSYAANNTHGSIAPLGDLWWVFYHRAPRGFGHARQAMVAPISIKVDLKPVSEGGHVTIRAFDPYTDDRSAKASDGSEYTGAEVTSEGFQIYGLDPYRYYSAGYACFLSAPETQTDSWDIWDNGMPVAGVSDGHIIGYKYFGFGGLAKDTGGLKAFEGARPGNHTALNLWLTPLTAGAFKINVWLDGPWDNETWYGKKMGEITVPAGSAHKTTRFTLDVADFVDGLDGKHALYLVAEGAHKEPLFDLIGLGFGSKNKPVERPVVPEVKIMVDGAKVDLPTVPVRATSINGLVGYDRYEATVETSLTAGNVPVVTASSSDPDVKIAVTQAASIPGVTVVRFDYRGVVKTYNLILK